MAGRPLRRARRNSSRKYNSGFAFVQPYSAGDLVLNALIDSPAVNTTRYPVTAYVVEARSPHDIAEALAAEESLGWEFVKSAVQIAPLADPGGKHTGRYVVSLYL